MRKLLAGLTLTLAPVIVHAAEFNGPKVAFGLGAYLGSAEVYASGCATAVVDPKKRQTILNAIGPMYQDAFTKGILYGMADANAAVAHLRAPRPADEATKRCMIGIYLYGPEGKAAKNLIIPLR